MNNIILWGVMFNEINVINVKGVMWGGFCVCVMENNLCMLFFVRMHVCMYVNLCINKMWYT